MQPNPTGARALSALHDRLMDLERLTTAQEWWLYGAVLPKARRIAEIVSLLTAARADLVYVLGQLGLPHLEDIALHSTGELRFAQSFAHDAKWARAHDEEATSLLRLITTSAPSLVAMNERLLAALTPADAPRSVSGIQLQAMLRRVSERLREIAQLAGGS